ncbi:MAG TPA: hypothetical protein VLE43_00705 [Candidatus Saccharimonadia bacterium]|nr:hypothetical protein [Candidatus Saccharimonadia bacterium]
MPEEHPLTGKTPEDLRKLGETICSVRDWRWCVHWICALHRQFRPHFTQRDYWTALDELIASELEWHRGRDLFDVIRRESLASISHDTAEDTHYRIAEIGAKCISNASWSPGLFDFNAPYDIPALVIHLTRQLSLPDEERRLAYHFISLAYQSQHAPVRSAAHEILRSKAVSRLSACHTRSTTQSALTIVQCGLDTFSASLTAPMHDSRATLSAARLHRRIAHYRTALSHRSPLH